MAGSPHGRSRALPAHPDLGHQKPGVGGCFWEIVFRIKNFLLKSIPAWKVLPEWCASPCQRTGGIQWSSLHSCGSCKVSSAYKKRHQIPHIFNCYSHGDTLLKEIYIQHLSPTCLWYSNYYLMYILLSVLIVGSQQMENMYSDKHRKLQFYTYKLRWKRGVCSALGKKQGISEISFPNKPSCFKLLVFPTKKIFFKTHWIKNNLIK